FAPRIFGVTSPPWGWSPMSMLPSAGTSPLPRHIEVLRRRMVHDQRCRGLFRLELELLAQPQTDSLRLQQSEEMRLVLERRAGRITERVAAAAVVLLEELLHLGGV